MIVTKNSEIKDLEEFECKFQSGESYKPELVAVQEDYDLALLRVSADNLKPLGLLPDPVAVGSIVSTIDENGKAISIGLSSVEQRRIRVRGARNSSRAQAFLGVQCGPNEDGAGILIVSVNRNTAARRAGLRDGDVFLKFGDIELNDVNDLVRGVRTKKPGEEVELQLIRDGEDITKTAKLGERTTTPQYDRWGGGPFSDERFGFPEVIAHDGVIRPNQVGGPLFDSQGKVVGVNLSRSLRVATYAAPAQVLVDFLKANR